MIKVTIWNEFYHEKSEPACAAVYPNGIHNAIAEFLKCDDIAVRTATLDEPDCGLSQELLDDTDVMIWWGHMRHSLVPDEIAEMVANAVLKGMGIIFLHSAHHSKPFIKLMGTPCHVNWRDEGDFERVWVVDPAHPIAQGLGRYFELAHEEAYSEPFNIPAPDRLVFTGWYEGGEVFRSGCCYVRGLGRIFYFQPGHETYPTYYDGNVQLVIRNAVRWAAPNVRVPELTCPMVEAPEKHRTK